MKGLYSNTMYVMTSVLAFVSVSISKLETILDFLYLYFFNNEHSYVLVMFSYVKLIK